MNLGTNPDFDLDPLFQFSALGDSTWRRTVCILAIKKMSQKVLEWRSETRYNQVLVVIYLVNNEPSWCGGLRQGTIRFFVLC